MNRLAWLFAFAIWMGGTATGWGQTGEADRPNILVILADDLGYGDVACYNPESKVATRHLDQLAAEGMRFTDAHSPSTVCTPTRYSLLTGRMCFRTGFPWVFAGVGGPCLIEPERMTLADMLRGCGYRTAMFGKWHIGLTCFDEAGQPIHDSSREAVSRIDFERSIAGGPLDHGFDTFFGTASCPTTDWLYAYIEGDRIPVPPNRVLDRAELPQHPYTIDCRPGRIAPDFELDRVDLKFLERSQAFLREHHREHADEPFFLFHSMQAVHLPSLPAAEFQGKSGAGPHGDFIWEMDWIVGQLMGTLDELGMTDNTLVIFCSDNGPEVPSVIAMRRDHQHDGARPWRGMKRDQWEGGHRTPLIVRWPKRVRAGSVVTETVCLTDVFATCADLLGQKLPNDAAEDSFSWWPLMRGEPGEQPLRPYTLHQTPRNVLAIRQGDWKYLDHPGSGGNDYNRDGAWGLKAFKLPAGSEGAPGQLYNLADDPGETRNLYHEHPEVVARLKKRLDATVESGRSAPGR